MRPSTSINISSHFSINLPIGDKLNEVRERFAKLSGDRDFDVSMIRPTPINEKWVSIFDPYYPDLKPVYKKKLLDHWKEFFNSDDDNLIATTLSATTKGHALLNADKCNILIKCHSCHFPQLSKNRLDGTVHTDTALCNVLGTRREK